MGSSEPKQKDDLGAELDSMLERPTAPCKYARVVTPEFRALIRERVDNGKRVWAGYERFLHRHGMDIEASTIMIHFKRGHDDDR